MFRECCKVFSHEREKAVFCKQLILLVYLVERIKNTKKNEGGFAMDIMGFISGLHIC